MSSCQTRQAGPSETHLNPTLPTRHILSRPSFPSSMLLSSASSFTSPSRACMDLKLAESMGLPKEPLRNSKSRANKAQRVRRCACKAAEQAATAKVVLGMRVDMAASVPFDDFNMGLQDWTISDGFH